MPSAVRPGSSRTETPPASSTATSTSLARCHAVAATSRIDHPLDPENRWLTHAGVESPERKSVYDGTVVLDKSGEATVALPAYVSKLNADFRYQLTCIGGHAPVYVAREIRKDRFRIAGGRAGLKVSWQVTGVRRDDYARAHPVEVETAKTGEERGTRIFVPKGSGAKRMPTGRFLRNGKEVDPRTVDAASSTPGASVAVVAQIPAEPACGVARPLEHVVEVVAVRVDVADLAARAQLLAVEVDPEPGVAGERVGVAVVQVADVGASASRGC